MTVNVPIERQVECVERELGMRRRVYGRRVHQGQMSQAKADDEIEAMQAVLETLQQIAANARLI